jgi:hypothetical protein
MTLYFFSRRYKVGWSAILWIALLFPFSGFSLEAPFPSFNPGISIVCPTELTVPVFGSNCAATVQLPLPQVLMQSCNGNPSFLVETPFGLGLGPHPGIPVGNYNIRYSVTSPCGDTASCTFQLKVVDKRNPSAVLVAALYANIQANGMVLVRARQFNQASTDNCTPFSRLAFSFSANKQDSIRIFHCSQVGVNNLFVTVHDEAGNTVTRPVIVTIQDLNGHCREARLVGQVNHFSHSGGVDQVLIRAQAGNSVFQTETTETGSFSILRLQESQNYRVTALKDDDHQAGVNAYDLFLLQQYLLGNRSFPSLFHRIAADINGDKELSSLDLKALQDLILGRSYQFLGNTSWKFIPENHQFTNQNNPWETPIPDFVYQSPGVLAPAIGFIAVKVGDLNPVAHQARPEAAPERSFLSVSCILSKEDNTNASEVIHLVLPKEVVAFQASLPISTLGELSILEHEGGEASLSLHGEKTALVCWKHEDNAMNLSLDFKVKRSHGSAISLENILGRGTWMGFDEEGKQIELNLDIREESPHFLEEVFTGDDYSVSPNPMRGQSFLHIEAENTETPIQIRIVDALGRLCRELHVEAQDAANIPLHRSEFREPGVYLLHIERAGQHQTLRLVVL